MKKRRVLARLALAAAGVMLVGSVATAASGEPDGAVAVADIARDAHQHGTEEGHLHPEGSHSNVQLIGKLKLKNVVPEKIADVGVFKGYAYLAAWGVVTCKYNGVHVVDVRNPAAPKEAAFIQAKEGSYPGEGIQALHIDTTAYNGDILVSNNEKCKDMAGFGGMNIYDISKPASPTPLVEGIGDSTVNGQGKKDANEIHSVFAWDAGSKAYAVIVDNEEGTDVDIIDITDPKKAAMIAEYDLDQKFPQILQASPTNLVEVFFHDVVVKQIGGRQVMLLSYWDAGYVAIDVTDPLNPTYIGDTDFTNPDPEAAESGFTVAPEGNGHEAEFTKDNQYIIGVDERGVCTFTEKVANVINAGGYDAVLVFNRTGTDACDGTIGMSVEGNIPTFGVAPRSQGFAIFDVPYDNAACLAGTGPAQLPVTLGTKGDTLRFSSTFDGWGYVHLFRYENGKMDELDTYAISEAHDPAFASGFGDLTVHEAATSPTRADLVYFSYYAAGFRVAKIAGGKLTEVGHYIDVGGNNFWGVQVFQHAGQEYVAASDRDYGLYIFRYTGSA